MAKPPVYRPRPGARLTIKEAEIVGESTETLREELSRSFTVEEYETFCRRKIEPVHPIWKKKRDEISADAGRAAAAYLLRSFIVVEGKQEIAREGVIVLVEHKGLKTEHGTVHTPDFVRASGDLLDLAEEQFCREVKASMAVFANVAGMKRMKKALAAVVEEVAKNFS